jgi:hypothetical protein
MKITTQILTLAFLLMTGVSKAQDFEIAPVELNFRLDPGDKEEKYISITNHSSFTQEFQLTKADFSVGIDGARTIMDAGSGENSCADWITFGEGFFSLEPNESRAISIGMEAPAGNYATRWAIVYVQTAEERTAFSADQDELSAGVMVSGRIGIKVFRYPLNSPKPQLKISSLRKDEESLPDEHLYAVNIENTGASVADCKVSFIALNLKTAEKHSYEGDQLRILPGSIRELSFTLPDTLPPGEYVLSAILDYGDKNVLEGTRMRTKIVIEDDTGE